jgi:hypothetical protein
VIAWRLRRAMKEEGEEGKSDTTSTSVLPRCQCIGG